MVTEVVVAFGSSNVYYGLGPLGAGMAMVGILYGGASWTVKSKGLLG